MKIVLLSAYDAMSHRYWRKGLVEAFPDYDWTVLTLPPRHFNWRLRGNSLSWAFGERAALEQPYDLVICTSMTDLSALKGMVPALAQVPTLCYFHENQFAYPASDSQNNSVEPLILNLYTALAADQVLFNSAYNRETFLQGAKRLLKKLPDYVPPDVLDRLRQRSAVLPVPLPEDVFQPSLSDTDSTLQILFNHRWEYDKAPERFFKAIKRLNDHNVDFRLHVAGQRFRRTPDVFDQAKKEFANRIDTWGYVESLSDYRRLLQGCDVVVSSAIHDFQGIAVLEAVASGCCPVVPDRLAYKELFPHRFRYRSSLEDPDKEAANLAGMLIKRAEQKASHMPMDAPDIRGLGWEALKPCYQEWMAITAFGSIR